MRRAMAGAVTALLLAAGISLLPIWPERDEPRAAAPPGGQAQRAKAKPVEPVLAGTTLDDRAVSVPAGRPAVLFFFTVGCGTCFPGAQELVKARNDAGDAADYVAVDLDFREPSSLVKQFFTAAGDPDFPVLLDQNLSLGTTFDVEVLGTLAVFDAQGRETFRKVDPSAGEILEAVRAASAA